jgi:negative regulator of flagellin synthesis FlgM
MQINDANLHRTSQSTTSRTDQSQGVDQAKKTSSKNTADSNSSDVAELSSFAQIINELGDGSASREARVEELRKLVESGRYEVDSQALAKKIVNDEFGLD